MNNCVVFCKILTFDLVILQRVKKPQNTIENIVSIFSTKKCEDTKKVIKIRKSKNTMVRTKKDKRTNHDLQNIPHKTKDRATRG